MTDMFYPKQLSKYSSHIYYVTVSISFCKNISVYFFDKSFYQIPLKWLTLIPSHVFFICTSINDNWYQIINYPVNHTESRGISEFYPAIRGIWRFERFANSKHTVCSTDCVCRCKCIYFRQWYSCQTLLRNSALPYLRMIIVSSEIKEGKCLGSYALFE